MRAPAWREAASNSSRLTIVGPALRQSSWICIVNASDKKPNRQWPNSNSLLTRYRGVLLLPRRKIALDQNFEGLDIRPEMVAQGARGLRIKLWKYLASAEAVSKNKDIK